VYAVRSERRTGLRRRRSYERQDLDPAAIEVTAAAPGYAAVRVVSCRDEPLLGAVMRASPRSHPVLVDR
jgi:hypothetical protein